MIYAHVGSQFGQELPISDVLSKFRFTDSRPESRFGRDRSDESMQYSGSIGTTFVPSESTPDNLASEILEMVASDAKSRPEIESHMELPSQTDIAFTNGRASTALKSGEGYVVDGIVVRATDLFSFNGILADETEQRTSEENQHGYCGDEEYLIGYFHGTRNPTITNFDSTGSDGRRRVERYGSFMPQVQP
jgi:hypothetical protein